MLSLFQRMEPELQGTVQLLMFIVLHQSQMYSELVALWAEEMHIILTFAHGLSTHRFVSLPSPFRSFVLRCPSTGQ
jgi:hypothetical protein